MFYKVCVALALGILTLSLVGSLANANSVTLDKQDFVDDTARRYSRTTYFVPIPGGYYGGTGGGGGSSRSSYDGVRGGGPGSGK